MCAGGTRLWGQGGGRGRWSGWWRRSEGRFGATRVRCTGGWIAAAACRQVLRRLAAPARWGRQGCRRPQGPCCSYPSRFLSSRSARGDGAGVQGAGRQRALVRQGRGQEGAQGAACERAKREVDRSRSSETSSEAPPLTTRSPRDARVRRSGTSTWLARAARRRARGSPPSTPRPRRRCASRRRRWRRRWARRRRASRRRKWASSWGRTRTWPP